MRCLYPLILANAGTQIAKRAGAAGLLRSTSVEFFNLGPGIRRDERVKC